MQGLDDEGSCGHTLVSKLYLKGDGEHWLVSVGTKGCRVGWG